MNNSVFLLPLFFISSICCFQNSIKADYLYRNEAYDNSIYGKAYRSGSGKTYYEMDDDDPYRSSIYDSQIKDREGNIYNCNSIGSCKYRGY